MVLNASEIRPGKTIEFDGGLFKVLDYNHNKTGRGGAVIKIKIKNIDSGSITEKTFRPGDKVEEARIEGKAMQFLYKDENIFNFMDLDTFEQLEVSEDIIGDAANYLLENMEIDLQIYKENVIGVNVPLNMVLEVVQTDPGFKGDTVNNVTKPATMETGLIVQVPMFVNEGDKIKVDTRNGNYIERA